MIKDFQILEQEFLSIEPMDSETYEKFYNSNKIYFDKGLPKDKIEQSKYLTMISSIGNSFSFSAKHQEAINILQKAYYYFRQLKLDNNSNEEFNQILFCLGYSSIELRKYYSALCYFKKHLPSKKKLDEQILIIQICKDNLINKWLTIFAVLGVIIISFKYLVKWCYPDLYTLTIDRSSWLGIVLLLSYYIFYRHTKKPLNYPNLIN